jgi:succinyl-CoA synthetase alpha subunit
VAILIDAATRVLVQGITGREAVAMTRAGLDYGARLVAGVTPGKGGQEVHGVPVFDTVRRALAAVGPIDVAVVSVPPAAARDAVFEAADAGIPLVVVSTERVPRLDVAQLLAYASRRGCRVIGPNTMGLIAPGLTKVGSVGGPAADTRRAYAPGPVGILSRSGGMTTEIASLLTLHGLGQSTAVSIGGDPLVGSTFADLFPLFEADPQTRVVVMYAEPGGTMEADLAEYVRRERPRTPCVVFVAGRFMDEMRGVRFGHAGTIVQGRADSAAEKIRLLRDAGLHVAEALSDIPAIAAGLLGLPQPIERGEIGEVGSAPAERRGSAPPAKGREEGGTDVRGMFVNLRVRDGCAHAAGCRVCVDVCPVDIFAPNPGGEAAVRGGLEDECILCGLCAERCPERVVDVVRLY